ncbi:unnamed protein product [Cylindrotheca closterium]|nr:unnamed protein product [Cylindrotheca closterium]
MDNEPINQIQKDHVSAFTYLIHCGCEEEEDVDPDRRLLRVASGTREEMYASRDAINMAFHSGDLFFDDQLKELHGLN